MSRLLDRIASDAVIDAAFAWLCDERRAAPDGADVWDLRFLWDVERVRLQDELRRGVYEFAPLRLVELADDTAATAGVRVIGRWSARDALVLKAMAIVLGDVLAPVLSARCFHVRGHGGLHGAVRAVHEAMGDARFVLRSDVDSYYASVDHERLVGMLRDVLRDCEALGLLERYLGHVTDWNGELRVCTRGISAGCPLAPLLGGLYLRELDEAMVGTGLFYARYMDDWVVLAPSRWKLRKAVRRMNGVLSRLRMRKHAGKTFIGRIERGFAFLGYRFGGDLGASGIGVAGRTVERMLLRAARLYERGASSGRVGAYVRR